jgi:NAD(P)-dependent dehydrogenase (short-subunit alcohol dehydrogenase family)
LDSGKQPAPLQGLRRILRRQSRRESPLELADDRILVNAIAPGPMLAPEEFSEAERKAVEEATPLGRWGGAEEIAKAVIALVDSDFITGETIRVDGGRHLR